MTTTPASSSSDTAAATMSIKASTGASITSSSSKSASSLSSSMTFHRSMTAPTSCSGLGIKTVEMPQRQKKRPSNECFVEKRSGGSSSYYDNGNSSISSCSVLTTTNACSEKMAKPRKSRIDEMNTITSPQEYFTALLQSRGYPGTTFCSLKGGYRNDPTEHQTSSYGVRLTKAIRSSNLPEVRLLLQSGLSPNACNKFGESIIHAVCRRGDHKLLSLLLHEFGSSVQICDDFGRTPLHDACWTSRPNFETITLLLEKDPWLMCVTDCRGATPLSYVKDKSHWALWIGFLGAVSDKYWPCLKGSSSISFEYPVVPPLCCELPNSRPLPPPKGNDNARLQSPPPSLPSTCVIQMIASGQLDPQDVDKKISSTGINSNYISNNNNGTSTTINNNNKCGENKKSIIQTSNNNQNEPRRRVGITLDPILLQPTPLGREFVRVSTPIQNEVL